MSMSNATDLGMSEAFEAAVVEYCLDAVRHGETMSRELAVYDNIKAKGGTPTVRTIDDAVISGAPADARSLLARHRTDGK